MTRIFLGGLTLVYEDNYTAIKHRTCNSRASLKDLSEKMKTGTAFSASQCNEMAKN